MPSHPSPQALQHPALVIAVASLTTYLVFKRFEPSKPMPALALLVGVPTTLAFVLRDHFTSLTTATYATAAVHWALLTLFVGAYRVSPFHPLARYPGPLQGKLSKCWMAYLSASGGKTHVYIDELHRVYGDVVRIGPNELSVRHKDACTTVLGPKGLPRGPYYDTREHDSGVSLDGIRDPALHAVRRRPWARAMNSASTKYFEELVQHTVSDLTSGLEEHADEPVDLTEWMSFFGLDFMARMAFSYDYNMLVEGRDTQGLRRMIDQSLEDLRWISHIPWSVPYLRMIPGATKNWDDMKAVGDKVARHRVSLGSSRPDLFHHLMDEEGHEAARPQLEAVSVDGTLAIVAGADTGATTLAHFWMFMLRHPACFVRLRQEVDAAFARDDGPDPVKQARMPYLNACLNETLRLFPPVLAGLQRRVGRGTGGKMIGDYFIPEDTQVSLVAYAVHRNPECFSPFPDTFWPDRWLMQESYTLPTGEVVPSSDVLTRRDSFMTFSQGPMVCAGKNVALAEMRAAVCAVVQRFDLVIADEQALNEWEDALQECYVSKLGKLPVQVVPRD